MRFLKPFLAALFLLGVMGCASQAPKTGGDATSTASAPSDTGGIQAKGTPTEAALGAPIPATAQPDGELREVTMGGPKMMRAKFKTSETPDQVAQFYKDKLASIDEEKRTDDTIILNGKNAAGATVALVIEQGGEGESGTEFSVAVTGP